jgi:spermidine/putrescine transport system substrate-binding protein
MRHPKERRRGLEGTTRRDFLGRTGGAAIGLAGLGSALSACANSTGASTPSGKNSSVIGPFGIHVSRPDSPVALPLYADNKAIASGMAPEKNATLQIYNWDAYLNQAVVSDFEKTYNCKVQVTTFTTMDEAMAKMTARTTQFDIFVPTVDNLAALVGGKIIQPLNLSYIPNLAKNIWTTLQSPWYDVHSRYTVPYTIWTTGIAWRNDKLPKFDPSGMNNPYDIFWQSTGIAGKVALLDDQRDAISMVLLRNGITDINTENAADLKKVQTQLLQLVQSTNLKFDTVDYTDLPNGTVWLHQAWSGDIISVPYYMPKGLSPDVISYWWPKDGHGIIGNDTVAIVQGAKSPVLAHLFLNHILDYKQALLNMSYTGYQQPQKQEDPNSLVSEKLVNPAQKSCIVYESQFKYGYQEGTLSTAGQTRWENAWTAVKAGG